MQESFIGLSGNLPNASAGAQFNENGVGVYANVECFKLEGNIGIGQAYINPNLNTGIGKNYFCSFRFWHVDPRLICLFILKYVAYFQHDCCWKDK